MRIIATTSNLVGARFIRFLIKEEASHLIFVFDDVHVIESSLFGVDTDYYPNYKKHVVEVDSVELYLPLEVEYAIWKQTMELCGNEGYDYPGILYSLWRALLFKFFKIPPPPTNKWAKGNLKMCTEMYNIIRGLLPELRLPDQGDVTLKTPLGIIAEVKKSRGDK